MPTRTPRPRAGADACPGVFAPHDAADGALARIRLPGGVVSAAALRTVADCADELGDGRVHLTSRGNLQLRGLSRTGPLVARLSAAGLLPSMTHERVRNVLASPLSGVATDPVVRIAPDPGGDRRARAPVAVGTAPGTRGAGSPADDRRGRASAAVGPAVDAHGSRSCDVRGLAAELDHALCARPALATLPGRFLFALDDARGDVAGEDPDLCWRAVSASAGVLIVGGVAVAEVAVADAARVLVDAAEAFLALRAGGTAWRAAELPGAPARVAAALGLPLLQESHVQAASLLERGFPASGAAAVPGAVRRDDGGVALVVAPLLGELSADQVRLLADAARTPGADPIRTPDADVAAGPRAGSGAAGGEGGAGSPLVVTPWRTVVLPDPRVPAAELAAAGLVVVPGPAADVSACAGRPGCAKALADVRADIRAALALAPGRLPAGRTHVSGCARRCGAPRGPHVDAVALDGGGYLVDGVPRAGLAPVARGHLTDAVPNAGRAR